MKRLSRWLRRRAQSAHSVFGRTKENQQSPPCRFEVLEARTLLSTLSIDALGSLQYRATDTIQNHLSIGMNGGFYTFSEASESINVIGAGSSGCVGSGGGFVMCPDSAISALSIDVSDNNDTVTIHSSNDPMTIHGGLGDDTLHASGAAVRVTIDGGIGNDSIVGGMAGDILNGGNGDDNISGGPGNDTITGASGNDILAGGDGVDELAEASDASFALTNMSLTGLGSDALSGFERAFLTGGAGNNTLDASAFSGATTLDGGSGNDSLAGAQGNDRLLGGDGNDTLSGGLGNDVLVGGSGNDSLDGGGGTDQVDHSAAPVGVKVNLKVRKSRGEGQDRLLEIEGAIGSPFADLLVGNNLANLLIGGAGRDKIVAQAGEDTLVGGDHEDILNGGAGNDLLLGGAANDILIGHLGRDILIGGTGSDQIIGTHEQDILITGRTDHDNNDTALAAIMFEWTSPRDYQTRRNNLRDGSGSLDRFNAGFFFSQTTVHEDGVADRLTGSSEEDWFFGCSLGPKKDQFTDRLDEEFFEQLCPNN